MTFIKKTHARNVCQLWAENSKRIFTQMVPRFLPRQRHPLHDPKRSPLLFAAPIFPAQVQRNLVGYPRKSRTEDTSQSEVRVCWAVQKADLNPSRGRGGGVCERDERLAIPGAPVNVGPSWTIAVDDTFIRGWNQKSECRKSRDTPRGERSSASLMVFFERTEI